MQTSTYSLFLAPLLTLASIATANEPYTGEWNTDRARSSLNSRTMK